jgi:phosphatidylserine/phosphatidylglycerophosphate/cardiolipin synthase-like enzyme
MHAKFVVADDMVFVGSYNLSHSGEENAENVLEIHDAAVADRLVGFADDIRGRYPPIDAGAPPPGDLPTAPPADARAAVRVPVPPVAGDSGRTELTDPPV